MDVKRYFRGPVIWIVLAVLAVVVLMQVVGSGGGYKTVDTGQVLQAIDTNQAKSAQLTTGDDNSIKVQLQDGYKIKGSSKVRASYIGDQGAAIAATCRRSSTARSRAPSCPTATPSRRRSRTPSSASCCPCCPSC